MKRLSLTPPAAEPLKELLLSAVHRQLLQPPLQPGPRHVSEAAAPRGAQLLLLGSTGLLQQVAALPVQQDQQHQRHQHHQLATAFLRRLLLLLLGAGSKQNLKLQASNRKRLSLKLWRAGCCTVVWRRKLPLTRLA